MPREQARTWKKGFMDYYKSLPQYEYPSIMGRLKQCCLDYGPQNPVDWRENFKGSQKPLQF